MNLPWYNGGMIRTLYFYSTLSWMQGACKRFCCFWDSLWVSVWCLRSNVQAGHGLSRFNLIWLYNCFFGWLSNEMYLLCQMWNPNIVKSLEYKNLDDELYGFRKQPPVSLIVKPSGGSLSWGVSKDIRMFVDWRVFRRSTLGSVEVRV